MNTTKNNSGLYIGIGIIVVIIAGALFYMYRPAAPITGDTVGTTPQTTGTDSTDTKTPVDATVGTSAGATAMPGVETAALAAHVSSTTAIIAGTVIPHGGATVYWFEYGTTTNFDMRTIRQSAGAGNTSVAEAAILGGLKPGTQYSFRMGAQNSKGTVYGGVERFITPAK